MTDNIGKNAQKFAAKKRVTMRMKAKSGVKLKKWEMGVEKGIKNNLHLLTLCSTIVLYFELVLL